MTLTPDRMHEIEQKQDILDFWFSADLRKQWFASTPALDQRLLHRFESTWARAATGDFDHWNTDPEGCLALIIILDQFPLNMFRGHAKSFSTEAQSINIARHAVAHGFDHDIEADRLAFLYMPFMHSENLANQNRSVELFTQAGLQANIRFAKHHHEIVRLFGRFPHRNAIFGRTSTPAELDYLASDHAFTG